MKFLDSISKFLTSVTKVVSTTTQIVNTVRSAKSIGIVTNNVIKANPTVTKTDPESSSTVITLQPDPKNKIPVLYGRGISKGIIFDAQTSDAGRTLWLAYVLSEVTGNTISGTPSELSLRRVFMNGYQLFFDLDGITAKELRDTKGNTDNSIAGLIRIYFYKNGSANPAFPLGFGSGAFGETAPILPDARILFPGWGNLHTANNLAFVIVKVIYSDIADLKGIPDLSFELENTMNDPGDVLFDYLTNTRYGAGIPVDEVNVE